MKGHPNEKRHKLWVGVSDGEIHFYRSAGYYDEVLHADLFRTRKAAKVCYEDVRAIIVCERGPSSQRRKA
jgi:hypothetical protein